jgi:hypothetical protein
MITGTLIIFVIAITGFGANVAEDQKPTVIVVVGAPGTTEYGAEFAKWAELWEKACLKGQATYILIGLNKIGTSDSNEPNQTDDRTILQQILAGESKDSAGALWLVFIGHGTYDGRAAKFNLHGPDISADDLTDWLKSFSRPIAVINNASSSAPFLSKLSGQGRVVIIATKSGFEQNYARFGQYMADAIANTQADLDKDGQTSLLESFLFASGRVDEFYSAAGRLATERALLDDNADGLGTRADWYRGVRPIQKAEGSASPDGYLAHQFHIVYSETESQMPPDLRAKRDKLELEVVKLRDSKENFSEEEYFSKLESLLYEIAKIYEQSEEQ